MILPCVGRDPVVGVGQGDALPLQLSPDAGVDKRGRVVGIEALELGKVFLSFEQCAGTRLREELAVKEFRKNVPANQWRIVANGERLDLAMAPAQQLDRTSIKQYRHGSRLPDGCWGDASG